MGQSQSFCQRKFRQTKNILHQKDQKHNFDTESTQSGTDSEDKTVYDIRNIKSSQYTDLLSQRSFKLFNDMSNPQINRQGQGQNNVNANKQKRIQNEHRVMAKNLPVFESNSIFAAGNEKDMDHMRAIISGSEDTPYAFGLFLFDILCHDNFPNKAPEMKILTTGGDTLRFNPNLYNSGFVCLSILGTWSGNAQETWDQKRSNILQVLVSIQSLVMNEDVLYQEPSYNKGKGNQQYELYNTGYCNIVKYGNVRYAMNDMLMNPPPEFKEEIQVHFYLNKEKILKQVQKWVEEADKDFQNTMYDSLTSSHNNQLANKFRVSKDVYKNELNGQFKILQENLENLKFNVIKNISFVSDFIRKHEKEPLEILQKKFEVQGLTEKQYKVMYPPFDEKHAQRIKQKVLSKKKKRNAKMKF